MSLETLIRAKLFKYILPIVDFSISVPQNHNGIWRSLKTEVYSNNLQLCVVMVIGFISNICRREYHRYATWSLTKNKIQLY